MRPLSPQDRLKLESSLYRRDFSSFVRAAWPYICSDEMTWELPQQAITTHLQAVSEGDLGSQCNLVINVAPSSSKTNLVNILWPAWVWTRDPGHVFICVAHGIDATTKPANLFLNLVASNWYQEHFPEVVIPTGAGASTSKSDIRNTATGERMAFSPGQKVTGQHAHTILVDDICDSKDISRSVISDANTWFVKTLSSRVKQPTKRNFVVVAQRIAMNDLPSKLIGDPTVIGPVTHLCIPEILETPPCVTLKADGTELWRDPRSPGELAAPIRRPLDIVTRIKNNPEFDWQGQYQQNPCPSQGNLCLSEYLSHTYTSADLPGRWDKLGVFVDSSFGITDPTVAIVVGLKGPKLYFLDLIREVLQYPQLEIMLAGLNHKWRPLEICIEDSPAGKHIIQGLRSKLSNIIALPTGGKSKLDRFRPALGPLAGASVLLPEYAPWVAGFKTELLAFKGDNKGHDDQVDATAYAINRYLVTSGPSTHAILTGYLNAAKRM